MNVTPKQIDRIQRTIKLCRFVRLTVVLFSQAIAALALLYCFHWWGNTERYPYFDISWGAYLYSFIASWIFLPLWMLVGLTLTHEGVFYMLVLPFSNSDIKWVINEIAKFYTGPAFHSVDLPEDDSNSIANLYLQYLAFSYRRLIRKEPWLDKSLLNRILSVLYTEEEIQARRKREKIKKFVMDNRINTSENAIIQADDCFKSFFVITGHVEIKGDHELDHERSSQQLTILHTNGEICNIRTCEISKDTRIYIQKL